MLDWQIAINNIHEKHCIKIEKCESDTLLYHYTSPAGLLGIFNTSAFWLSDSDFLNDSSESDYFYNIFQQVVRSKDDERKKEKMFKFNAGMFSLYHTSSHTSHRETAHRIKETR